MIQSFPITYPRLILAQKYPSLILVILVYKLYALIKKEKHPITKALLCNKLISLTKKQ